MKILVTGNPNYGIAEAIKNTLVDHEVSFYSKNYNNFDLTDPAKMAELVLLSLQYDVFINNARLSRYSQVKLYEDIHTMWWKSKKKGSIINIGSTADSARDQHSVYATEKAALRKISDAGSFACNFKHSGIKVTYIAFGWAATPVLNTVLPHVKKHESEEVARLLKWVIEYPVSSTCINEIRMEPIQ